MNGVHIIERERNRQLLDEGFNCVRDDKYINEELALATVSYAMPPRKRSFDWQFIYWPWDEKWWKPTPKDRVRELAKAGALIAAEIDRLLRIKS